MMDNRHIQELADRVAKDTEEKIVGFLNNLIGEGIITIENRGIDLYSDCSNPREVQIGNSISLKIKDKELISELRNENEKLKERLSIISENIGRSV